MRELNLEIHCGGKTESTFVSRKNSLQVAVLKWNQSQWEGQKDTGHGTNLITQGTLHFGKITLHL